MSAVRSYRARAYLELVRVPNLFTAAGDIFAGYLIVSRGVGIEWPRLLALVAASVCLYNAGMDPHEGCPVGGMRGITTEIIEARERLVFDWCRRQSLPVAFVLAGGYTGPTLDRAGLGGLHRLTVAAALGCA